MSLKPILNEPKHMCSKARISTVKPVLSSHTKRKPKFGFQHQLSLNAGQKYCRMLQESILQYFQPSLSFFHLSLRGFVLSIFEWPLKTGFTVYGKAFPTLKDIYVRIKFFIISSPSQKRIMFTSKQLLGIAEMSGQASG